jgi:L,D-peptidoglycan transpeptidase YkuD (ErfK/YbiS/YcfS/YnhG family)
MNRSTTIVCGTALVIAAAIGGGRAERSVAAERADQAWSAARQLVLVTTSGWDSDRGVLRTFARTQDWHPIGGAVRVTIGRSGSAWGIGLHAAQPGPVKQEGDGRSPAGVFRIGTAFGYAAAESTALPYRALQASDYCMDVSTSPFYNRIVDSHLVGEPAIAGSTEPMRLDLHAHGDQRYRIGFVIEHNADGTPQAGSCIFAHLWQAADESTSGCTAMNESAMRSLLAWLTPEEHPIFVLLPEQEYVRVRTEWKLPVVVE